MKKSLNRRKNISRRDFTRSAATLVSLPLIPSLGSAQKRDAQPDKRDKTEHIPPMTLHGGSLHIKLKHLLKKRPGVSPPQFTATLEGPQYGEIAWIWVITEWITSNADNPPFYGGFKTDFFPFPKDTDCQLWLWLPGLKSIAQGSDIPTYEPLTNDPQFKIKGNYADPGQGNSLTVLITLDNDNRDFEKGTHSTAHPRNYQYKSTKQQDPQEYRIGRWRITDKNGNQMIDPVTGTAMTGEGAENYHFMVVYRD